MAIKNFWSLEPGEAIFADELSHRFKKQIDIYFPIKDSGIDLLAVVKNTKKMLSFQIKESRYYDKKEGDSSWSQESDKNLKRNKKVVDFYIFIIYYLPRHSTKAKKKKIAFETRYVIIPTKDVAERAKFMMNKDCTYDFEFRFEENGSLKQVRGMKAYKDNLARFDYTKYLNAWHLINDKINR